MGDASLILNFLYGKVLLSNEKIFNDKRTILPALTSVARASVKGGTQGTRTHLSAQACG